MRDRRHSSRLTSLKTFWFVTRVVTRARRMRYLRVPLRHETDGAAKTSWIKWHGEAEGHGTKEARHAGAARAC